MIFQHKLDKVLDGTKTQTRRLAKSIPPKRVGRTYSVQPGRGKRGVARIKILGVRRERACEISDADARAEGCENAGDFLRLWETIHGSNMNNHPVWVYGFELVKDKG